MTACSVWSRARVWMLTGAVLAAAIDGAEPVAIPPDLAIVGIWNFDRCDAAGRVANGRPGGGGVPAMLMGFAPEALTGVDRELTAFAIVRDGATRQVQVARSGWATFAGIPDNGLEPGINTPVGPQALALHAAADGNWIHVPGLATALVGTSGRATRSFGIAMWVLVQSEWRQDHAEFPVMMPLLRFARTDARFFLHAAPADRLYTEDVGNGMGGAYGYQIPWARREAAASRWVHLAFSADGAAQRFVVWVNGEPVNYREDKATSRPWPTEGGMQLSFTPGDPSDGAVMGRWLGGGGAPGRTIGVAALVVVNGEPLSQERARRLYALGRRGEHFDGSWGSAPEPPQR